MREFEPDLAFPPTLKVRLTAGDPYLSEEQVGDLAAWLRRHDREQLANAIETAFRGPGSFSPTADEKVELLQAVPLWADKKRADHRIDALLHCLRDTDPSDEPTTRDREDGEDATNQASVGHWRLLLRSPR